MILGFTPTFVAIAIFLATVFDVRLRLVLLLALAVALPLLVVSVLHLLENRDSASWLPQVLS